jgi:hypothetical protein
VNLFLPDNVIASKKTTALQGGHSSNNSDVFGSNGDCSSSNSNCARYLVLPDDVIASKKTTALQSGRPKGTTDASMKEMERNIELAVQESVFVLKAKQKESRSSKKRLRYGLLDDIIESAKKKNSVPDDVIIRKDCIRQRIKRTQQAIRLASNHP